MPVYKQHMQVHTSELLILTAQLQADSHTINNIQSPYHVEGLGLSR